MTTEELIEQLNVEDGASDDINAGLRTGADGEKYVVIYTPDDVEMLAVPTNATNWLDVHYNWYTSSDDIAAPAREIISSLISQYLNTPVSKRKTEKKYRLRWLDSTDPFLGATTYLGRIVDNELGNYYWSTFPDYSVELFTEDQLKKMKRDNPKLAPAIDAMKEEVKDDD